MLRLATNIPAYVLFRAFGHPRRLPFSLTCSLSFQCNSRCKTCNVYTKKSGELSPAEWERVFRSLGTVPYWVTISGGEPFLHKDLVEIVCSLYTICRPEIINIPTNGILTERIMRAVRHITDHCRGSQIVVNVSIDDIGTRHDAIRGIEGNYEKALATFAALKSAGIANLTVGIHTVISRYNVERIPDIYRHLITLHPDSYITEIAEERRELETVGAGITPEYSLYARAVDFLIGKLREERFSSIGRLTRAFRIEYYKMVKKVLKAERQIIPCFAGFASAQIAPDGDVWMCCINADPVGNVRDAQYDFKTVWFSEKADRARQDIKRAECFCPLANAAYTNMLLDPVSLCKVALNLLR